MQDFLQKLHEQIQARYPLFYFVSHEEERVWRAMSFFAQTHQYRLFRWRRTIGLESDQGVIPNTKEPQQALHQCVLIQEPSLFMLWDLHVDFQDPVVLRQIRDLCLSITPKRQALILLSPFLVVPSGLEKSMVVMDVPLPTIEEGQRLLQVLCQTQDVQITQTLFEQFVKGSLGLTEKEIQRLYSRILNSGQRFQESDLTLQIQEKKKAIHSSRFLEFWDVHSLKFKVGGLDNLKSWLQERNLAFTERARNFGLPEPKGLFLLGVQGCGKSLMAKSVAQEWQLPLLRLDVGALFLGGNTQGGLRDTIRIAESMAPVILWIDELEKGFAQAGETGSDSLGYFLTWMQEKQKMVFVIATANEVRKLPPELLRKGRFDEIFFVDLPDVHERLEILDIHLRNRRRDPNNYSLDIVAEETELFSGAELEQVIVSALYKAFASEREMDTEDILESSREIIPLAITMDDKLKDLREWARPRARRATADRRRVDFFAEW